MTEAAPVPFVRIIEEQCHKQMPETRLHELDEDVLLVDNLCFIQALFAS